MIYSIDGKTQSQDVRQERIAAGTVGGELILPKGVGGRKIQSVVDDSDPRITYGLVAGYGSSAASFSLNATTDFQFGGTFIVLGSNGGTGTPGAAAQLTFTGTSIAVLGGVNPDSGTMRVYIDGVETAGRIPIYTGFRISGSTFGSSIIDSDDATVPALAGALSFSASGRLFINGELIDYTSRDGNGFYGCTRGVGGTTATSHNANETIYQWASSIGLYSTGYASKQVIYYNPLLEPGTHTIVIVVETNATSGKALLYFDGFVATGSLLGASNIFTQIAAVRVPITTDANGHCEIGALVASNNDVSRLALLGYTQSNTEVTNTTALGNLGLMYAGNLPYLYIHNGPASSTFNLTITFAFIGETL